MSRPLALRTAFIQGLLVVAASITLVILLGHAFFTSWGWLVGPAAWLVCSLLTALILGLAPRRTMFGALLAGLPSIPFVAVGLHPVGDVLAIVLFAVWCASPMASLPRRTRSA